MQQAVVAGGEAQICIQDFQPWWRGPHFRCECSICCIVFVISVFLQLLMTMQQQQWWQVCSMCWTDLLAVSRIGER
jgi:hypothetical protein